MEPIQSSLIPEHQSVTINSKPIPLKVIIRIFSFVDVHDLPDISLVSKTWNWAANDNLVWRQVAQTLGFDILTKADKDNWKSHCQKAINNEDNEVDQLVICATKGRKTNFKLLADLSNTLHVKQEYRRRFKLLTRYVEILSNETETSNQEAKFLSQAYHILGTMHYSGKGTPQSYHHAVMDFRRAAEGTSVSGEALYQLGVCYYNGYGVDRCLKKAAKYFKDAAMRNIGEACNNLGCLYKCGKGVDQNFSIAKSYFEKAIELKFFEAYHNLADLYYKGNGVEQSYIKAIKCYETAGEKGVAESYHNLGNMYYEGVGVDQDIKKAIDCYKKAANLGYKGSYINLGNMYFQEIGIPQDIPKGVECLHQAFDSLPQALSKICYETGYRYEIGAGIEKNALFAKKFYLKAIELGIAESSLRLGFMYETGQLGSPDGHKALRYYLKAGLSQGYYNAALLFMKGQLMEKNQKLAHHFFVEAANLGNLDAERWIQQLQSPRLY